VTSTPPPAPAPDEEDTSSSSANRALLTGGTVLAVAMFAANGGNYLLNVFLGRWLTPPEFADANLMVTLMLLITAIAVSLQLIAARFAGINEVNGNDDATVKLVGSLQTRAATIGTVVALVLCLGASQWAAFFNSESAVPFVILGLGMPFYLVQAVGRGVLQGLLSFSALAKTFLIEMVVRVSLGIGLVAAGFGVAGATLALTASFVATWWAVDRAVEPRFRTRLTRSALDRQVLTYAAPVALLLLGQIIINNGDVLISKRALDPTDAGVYAAVALVGRAVFFLSWSVATTIFPAAAQRDEAGEQSNGLLYAGLAAVGALGLGAVVGAMVLGGPVLGRVFGPEYAGVSRPLATYAFATAVFAMANLIVSHWLALGRVREAVIMLVGGVAQTLLLLRADANLDALISAQVTAMLILLAAVSISHMSRAFRLSPVPRGATT